MVMDLNQVLLWFDAQGRRRDQPKRYFTVVDGVVGGEGNGPLAPEPVHSGFVVCGANPWAVDRVATKEMGLDVSAIPLLQRPLDAPDSFEWLVRGDAALVEAIEVGQRCPTWKPFEPHFGWKVAAGSADPRSRRDAAGV